MAFADEVHQYGSSYRASSNPGKPRAVNSSTPQADCPEGEWGKHPLSTPATQGMMEGNMVGGKARAEIDWMEQAGYLLCGKKMADDGYL